MKMKCEKKINDIEEELQKKYQLKLSKRVQ